MGGGINYKEQKKLKVYLSERPFADDCARLATYAAIIALKLPVNFDLDDFKMRLPATIKCDIVQDAAIRKQLFVILDAR